MIVDCHCHIFSKNDLTQDYRTAGRLVKRFQEIPLPEGRGGSDRFLRFMDHVLNYEAEHLFLKMRETYGEDYVAVPLMMDGTYVTTPAAEDFEKTSVMNRIGEQLKTPLNHLRNRPPEPNITHGRKDLFAHNFSTQMNELKRLKRIYPDHIYPFLGIDPRRNDHDLKGILMDLIKNRVGPGKTFSGIKLYTALGYSPTHPFLFKRDKHNPGLYQWCQKRGIPITVHFAPSGFAHINDSIRIKGDVYYPEAGEIVPGEELYAGGIMTFDSRFWHNSFVELVGERQLKLNHPLLWRKVLEAYPKLKINFAHMGGYGQAPYYIEGDPRGFWTASALEFLQDYPRVRVDLSNYHNQGRGRDILLDVKENIYDKLSRSCKKRVLYGSDFYMLYLMEKELNHYFERFCHYFGNQMNLIARENPGEFLNL
ncbi:MAG: amidohydrolase family protein [Spirochaetales bacterium]|nr:amidohydrolase family protein [Spirochaetales bacterium]